MRLLLVEDDTDLAQHLSKELEHHGFAVDPESCVAAGLRVTHWHLNDDTVAGLDRADRPVAGMQFHPESSPGPHDACGYFQRFASEVRNLFAISAGEDR